MRGAQGPLLCTCCALSSCARSVLAHTDAINIAFLIAQITGTSKPSPHSIALGGRVEFVDKLLTFLGVGVLASLSDVLGRKPLMAWSAFGFMLTHLLQATARGPAALYLADVLDGFSSCMTYICQAYVTDCSAPNKRATHLGIFQGLSIGLGLTVGFPIGGILGAKYGPRLPMLIGAAIQLVNCALILFVLPESLPKAQRKKALDPSASHPFALLRGLFSTSAVLSGVSVAWTLVTLAQVSLDHFPEYTSLRFGWTQEQAGPLMLLVGLSVAIFPRLLVPCLGMRQAILTGMLAFAAGLLTIGASPSAGGFISGILVVAVGSMWQPALQAFVTNMGGEDERGALLGALGSVAELTRAVGTLLFSSILAYVTDTARPRALPQGLHFGVAAVMVLAAAGVASVTLGLPTAAAFL